MACGAYTFSSVVKPLTRQKHTKYGLWVHEAIVKEAKFFAFVFESFRASSEGVRSCLDLLASKACSLALCSFEEFRSYATFELSQLYNTVTQKSLG